MFDFRRGRFEAGRGGGRMPRPPGVLTPCGACPKFPADVPVAERTPAAGRLYGPTDQTRRAIRHYRRCRATGRWPDDEIVHRNAGLLLEVEEAVERAERRAQHQAVLSLLTAARVA